MQTWWEGMAKARDRIRALSEVLGPMSSLEALQESERPAKGLLEEERVAAAIFSRLLQHPSSGQGDDPLCRWLYDTYQTGDLELQAVVLRFVPALCGVYLPRISSNGDGSLAGFEAVLLALYTSETKARAGRSLIIHIPDLAQPSLYHSPRFPSSSPSPEPRLGKLAPPLEPQLTVKATKRACIVGVALDLFWRRIAIMPSNAKVEACQCALRWATLRCSWAPRGSEVSADASFSFADAAAVPHVSSNGERMTSEMDFPSPSSRQVPEIEIVGPGELFLGNKSPHTRTSPPPHHQLLHQPHHQNYNHHQNRLPEPGASPKQNSVSPLRKHHSLVESPKSAKDIHGASSTRSTDASCSFELSLAKADNGVRILLPWELLQPLIKILGHCLLAPLNLQEVRDAASDAIKALHFRVSHDLVPEAILATRSLMRLDTVARAAAKNHTASVNSTPSKPRKPEILLVSK